MSELRQFVNANERWFRGHLPESDASLDLAEAQLAISIPQDIRWLLRDFGYWHATGISSLDETIENTIAAREHLKLPHRYIVLYDHQDGGVILLDTQPNQETGQNKVYDSSWESVPDELEHEIVYDSYLHYVKKVLTRQQDFIAPEDIDYDPTRYRTP
jgi:hypothetical protein